MSVCERPPRQHTCNCRRRPPSKAPANVSSCRTQRHTTWKKRHLLSVWLSVAFACIGTVYGEGHSTFEVHDGVARFGWWPFSSEPEQPTSPAPQSESVAPQRRGPPQATSGRSGFEDRSGYVSLGTSSGSDAPIRGSVIAVADMNRDRFMDLILLDTENLARVEIALWNHDMFRFEIGSSSIRLAGGDLDASVCPLGTISLVLPADLNDDGAIDLLLGNGQSGCVFYGDGSGGLARNKSRLLVTTIPELPSSAVVMDNNADLVPDIFVAFANGSRGIYQFSTSKATPDRAEASDGTRPASYVYHEWKSGADTACPVVESDIALPAFVDLDGDCLADLVIPTACGLEVWLNPVTISRAFTNMTMSDSHDRFHRLGTEYYNPAHGDGAIAFADFNGDGTIDLAVPNRNRRDLLVFLNQQRARLFGELCTADPTFTFSRRVGVDSGVELRHGSVGPLFRGIKVPTFLHTGDYDLDGLPDILFVDATSGAPALYRNLGGWNDERSAMKPHFRLVDDGTLASASRAGHGGDALAAMFFDVDQSGRQDILIAKKRNSTNLIWNSHVTSSDSLFFKGSSLSSVPYHQVPRPYAPVPGNTFKVTYMARNTRKRVTRTCSQCPQSGSWTLQICGCTFGLLDISNYIEEMAVGAGAETRSWTNLMPNSMAVVWARGRDSGSSWWMEYFTQRRGGQMLRVVGILMVALGAMGVAIAVLQNQERKEDLASESEHVQLFSFARPIM